MMDVENNATTTKPEQAPTTTTTTSTSSNKGGRAWVSLPKLVVLVILIINTVLLINLTVKESNDANSNSEGAAVGVLESNVGETEPAVYNDDDDDDDGMIGPELHPIPREDHVYILQAASAFATVPSATSGANDDEHFVDLTLQGVSNPVISMPVGTHVVEPGLTLKHFDTPENHIKANPAGPTFYSNSRPQAVLRYQGVDGKFYRTRVLLGEAEYAKNEETGEDIISFRNVKLEGKTKHYSATMTDVSASTARRDLLLNNESSIISLAVLEVSVLNSADCSDATTESPEVQEDCKDRLSDWPISSHDVEQCSVMYDSVWGRSPGTSIGRIDGLHTMDDCMAECCLNDSCQAITYHTNREPTRCWLLDRTYEGNFAEEPNPHGVKCANKVFDNSEEQLEIQRQMMADAGLDCHDPTDPASCQCIENWCNSISPGSECHTTTAGAFCTCQGGYTGSRCELEDDVYLQDTQEARNRNGLYCESYANDMFHTCVCAANSRGDPFCANGGTSAIALVGCTCECPPSHIGTRCETRNGPRR